MKVKMTQDVIRDPWTKITKGEILEVVESNNYYNKGKAFYSRDKHCYIFKDECIEI